MEYKKSVHGRSRDESWAPRLLHITTVPATLNFLRGQLAYLKSRGWDVQVLSAPGAALTEFGEQEAVTAHGARLERRVSPLLDLRAVWQIVRVLRSVRPTVVHAHTPKAGLLGLLAATICRVPVRIYQVRGLPLETATGWYRVGLRGCEWLACRLAHRVLCNSASLESVLLTEGICAPDKCATLLGGRGNGVDGQQRWNPERLTPAQAQTLRERLGLPDDALVVGYVGRLARDKGLADLEGAWSLLRLDHPSAQLLLLGAPDVRDPVPAPIIERLRADPSVHFVGRVDDPMPYYGLMDVVALPSYREGLPNVLLEAAALGLPVVATRTTGCVDAVQHEVTGLLVEPRSPAALAQAIGRYLHDAGLRVQHGRAGRERMLREFRPEPLWHAYHAEYEKTMRVRQRARPVSAIGAVGRRGFDLGLAAVLLILAAPLMAVIAIAVRLDVGSPILFRQVRAGAHGRPFTLHKFRTMRDLRTATGQLLPPAARLTRLGRWLRSTSLDELPELWDVLRGRMSLIGPRPLLLDYLPLYTTEQARRHDFRPGITGWAQVHGRNAISWEERLRLDVWYVDHASPLVDLHILLQTLPQVVTRKNTSPRDRTIMERFHGHA